MPGDSTRKGAAMKTVCSLHKFALKVVGSVQAPPASRRRNVKETTRLGTQKEKESRAGCGGFKTTLSRCYAVAASPPGQGSEAEPAFATRVRSSEGKVKFDRWILSARQDAGLVLCHTARNRVESVDTPPRNRSMPVSMSIGRPRRAMRGTNGQRKLFAPTPFYK